MKTNPSGLGAAELISADKLKAIMPRCSHPEYLAHINASLKEGQMNTNARKAEPRAY